MFEAETHEARRYFEALYPPGAPVTGYLAICHADPARTQGGSLSAVHIPAGDSARLAAAAVELSLTHGRQVWSSVCAHATDGGVHKRGTRADVCALPGFWVDIDLAGVGHAASDLPATVADAVRRLLIPFNLEPSLLIHTGGGLHAYWLLDAPAAVDGGNRAELQALAHGIQDDVRALANAHGWKLDKTSDLARILRPAGTLNRKPGRDVAPPVRILLPDGDVPQPRYSLDSLRGRFSALPRATALPPASPIFAAASAAPAPASEDKPAEIYTFESTREEILRKMRNNRKPERFETLQKILLGQPFAEKGARDQGLQQVASWLVWYCPEGDPEAALEILKPSLAAMEAESPDDFLTEDQAMEKITRAQGEALSKKAAAADQDARLRATLIGGAK